MAEVKKRIIAQADKPKVVEVKPSDKEIQEENQQNLLTKLNRLESSALHSRRKYDWEWMVRDLFVRGYHFAKYNRGNNTFTFSGSSRVRIPINLVHSQLRTIRSNVTAFRPKWEVMPDTPEPRSVANADLSGKLLDALYDKFNLRSKIKGLVHYGLIYSVGIWKIWWDDNFDNGQGEVRVELVDPYDLLIDPNATTSEDAEYMILAVRRPVEEVRKNPHYENTVGIQASKTKAVSEYKQFLLQAIKNVEMWQGGSGNTGEDVEQDTVILKEAWIKERDEDGEVKFRVITYVDDRILRNEEIDEKDFPFKIYTPETSPLEIYNESWAKHVIPINRVIDALESHIFEYNHIFARGRFVMDKNSGVRVITNENGQIIEKNRGSEVTNLNISPLPEAPFLQLQNMRRYQEDLGAVHEVSMGRVPAGVKSGVGIAELKQADAAGQDEIVDNLEDFLSQVGQRVLYLISKNYTTSKVIKVIGAEKNYEYFAVVGQGSHNLRKKDQITVGGVKLPVAVIGADNQIRVTVGSWLAFTKQARQQELKELFKLGAIDQKTLLQHLEFGDIESIIKSSRVERLFDSRTGVPSAGVQGQPVSDEELALAENEMMLEGKQPPAEDADNHDIHIVIHEQALAQGRDDIIENHIAQHQVFKRTQAGVGQMQQPGMGGVPQPTGQPNGQSIPMPPGPVGQGGGQVEGV